MDGSEIQRATSANKFEKIMDKLWKWKKGQFGKLEFAEQDALSKHLKSLGDVGEAIFRKSKSKRSKNQNDYYHGVVIKILSDETGNDPETIHEFIKLKFIPVYAKLKYTGGNLVGGSTTKLSVKEFEELMEKVRAWALMDEGIVIPLPNEVDYE